MTKKKTKTTETAVTEYDVLISCHNNETGKTYHPGDVVTDNDFQTAVIDNWLELDQPVLKAVE